MRSGPHQMNIGWLVLSKIRTAVRRLCGQVSGFPSGLLDQSSARINAPISPPPARKSAEVRLLIFNMWGSVASSAQTTSRNLAACHNPIKRPARHLVPNHFQFGGTKWLLTADSRFMSYPASFHEARGRKRAGDDGTDVDRATPRLTGRLRTAMECRPRPQHRGEIRHHAGPRSNRRNDHRGFL